MANSRQHDTMFQNLEGKTLSDVTHQMGPDFAVCGLPARLGVRGP